MLRPYEMSSVIITGPKNLQETIIKELHNLKILHIIEHSKNEFADIGRPLESANRLSEILVKVRALIAALNIKKQEIKFELKKSFLEIESTARKLTEELNINLEELKKTEELISKNESIKQELEILKDINAPLESFAPYKSLAYFTGYLKDENKALALKEELLKATQKLMLFHCLVKKRCFIVLFIDSKIKDAVSNILRKANFSPVSFVNIGNLKGNASANFKKIEEETAKLQKKKGEIKAKIVNLGKDYKDFLIASDDFLSEQLEKAEAPLKFAATPSSFLIKGWIPTDDLSKSIDRLNKITHNKIFVHFESAKKEDKVPVKLKNPKYAKAFEFFMDLYTLPTYKEIDPTFIMFLTYPLLFGFMLGDFGYGLTTLILFMILKRLMPKAKNFLNILIFSSLSTMFFGLLFGEFFGFEEIGSFYLPHILSRVHDINGLMFLALVVGIIHINLGLLIGFINEYKSHGFRTGLYAKGSWFIFEIWLVFVVWLFNFTNFTLSTKILILLLTLIVPLYMLYKGEGIRGIIEIPSIFSNTLSYARLMAIGLSSVVLALIINDSAEQFFHKGGFLVLIGVLILVIGHVINIMLGLLGSFLHSLRLHYVEFFTKFFHGGAKKYQPFGLKIQ
ncbi:V-type ATP synthase subunit I [Candidatus Woesearchaeota archaeon]|nr:V-type ATP synthase subunit I [Candidatus Woesearchaeota archaeon]